MTRNLVKRWFPASLFGLRLGQQMTTSQGRRRRGRSGQDLQGWETLEGRVVLTGWAWGGGSLLGTLSGVGIVTGPVVSNPQPLLPIAVTTPMTRVAMASINTEVSQLQTDWKALVTELQSLAAKSGVTVADIESLALDSQSIGQAGYHFNASSLHSVVSELATAVAGGTSTSQAQSDWTALFSSSSVSTTVVTSTFNDLVKAIQDSNVTTTDLTTVASDEAAIQTDLTNLGNRFLPASISAMGPSPLLATASVTALTVTLPTVPAAAASTVQSLVNNLPAVSEPIIVAPGIPIVLPWGGNLLGSLNHVGVVTGPLLTAQPMAMPATTVIQNSKLQQLLTDEKALGTEFQSLAAKSGVTVAELESLALDSQSIAQAGVHISSSSLNTVISELATAVAGGTSTSTAQSAWNALFTGSSLSTTVITNTFNDLVAAIGSSKVTTTDLTTVANDEAAIQTDLKNLFAGNSGSTGSGSGSTTGGSTGTGHSKPRPILHKPVNARAAIRQAAIASRHAKLAKALRKRI